MNVSERGLRFIMQQEGLKLQAYKDPVGKWTIGYGHTGGVKAGQKISRDVADALLLADVAGAARAVNELLKVEVTQNMFDALVSFVFNVGADIDADLAPEGLGDSTLLKLLNARDFTGAAKEFDRWVHGTVDGEKRRLKGLVRRRRKERDLFEEVA